MRNSRTSAAGASDVAGDVAEDATATDVVVVVVVVVVAVVATVVVVGFVAVESLEVSSSWMPSLEDESSPSIGHREINESAGWNKINRNGFYFH